MRGFLVLLVLLAGAACASEEAAPPIAPTDESAGPGFGVGRQSGGGSTGGAGGAGGQVGAGGIGGIGGATGACTGDADFEAFSFAPSGREVARRCVVSRCGQLTSDPDAYAGCVTTCMTTDVRGLSVGCALCYGELSRCELVNTCASLCRISVCTSACIGCLENAGCLSALDACTGIPDDSCTL